MEEVVHQHEGACASSPVLLADEMQLDLELELAAGFSLPLNSRDDDKHSSRSSFLSSSRSYCGSAEYDFTKTARNLGDRPPAARRCLSGEYDMKRQAVIFPHERILEYPTPTGMLKSTKKTKMPSLWKNSSHGNPVFLKQGASAAPAKISSSATAREGWASRWSSTRCARRSERDLPMSRTIAWHSQQVNEKELRQKSSSEPSAAGLPIPFNKKEARALAPEADDLRSSSYRGACDHAGHAKSAEPLAFHSPGKPAPFAVSLRSKLSRHGDAHGLNLKRVNVSAVSKLQDVQVKNREKDVNADPLNAANTSRQWSERTDSERAKNDSLRDIRPDGFSTKWEQEIAALQAMISRTSSRLARNSESTTAEDRHQLRIPEVSEPDAINCRGVCNGKQSAWKKKNHLNCVNKRNQCRSEWNDSWVAATSDLGTTGASSTRCLHRAGASSIRIEDEDHSLPLWDKEEEVDKQSSTGRARIDLHALEEQQFQQPADEHHSSFDGHKRDRFHARSQVHDHEEQLQSQCLLNGGSLSRFSNEATAELLMGRQVGDPEPGMYFNRSSLSRLQQGFESADDQSIILAGKDVNTARTLNKGRDAGETGSRDPVGLLESDPGTPFSDRQYFSPASGSEEEEIEEEVWDDSDPDFRELDFHADEHREFYDLSSLPHTTPDRFGCISCGRLLHEGESLTACKEDEDNADESFSSLRTVSETVMSSSSRLMNSGRRVFDAANRSNLHQHRRDIAKLGGNKSGKPATSIATINVRTPFKSFPSNCVCEDTVDESHCNLSELPPVGWSSRRAQSGWSSRAGICSDDFGSGCYLCGASIQDLQESLASREDHRVSRCWDLLATSREIDMVTRSDDNKQSEFIIMEINNPLTQSRDSIANSNDLLGRFDLRSTKHMLNYRNSKSSQDPIVEDYDNDAAALGDWKVAEMRAADHRTRTAHSSCRYYSRLRQPKDLQNSARSSATNSDDLMEEHEHSQHWSPGETHIDLVNPTATKYFSQLEESFCVPVCSTRPTTRELATEELAAAAAVRLKWGEGAAGRPELNEDKYMAARGRKPNDKIHNSSTVTANASATNLHAQQQQQQQPNVQHSISIFESAQAESCSSMAEDDISFATPSNNSSFHSNISSLENNSKAWQHSSQTNCKNSTNPAITTKLRSLNGLTTQQQQQEQKQQDMDLTQKKSVEFMWSSSISSQQHTNSSLDEAGHNSCKEKPVAGSPTNSCSSSSSSSASSRSTSPICDQQSPCMMYELADNIHAAATRRSCCNNLECFTPHQQQQQQLQLVECSAAEETLNYQSCNHSNYIKQQAWHLGDQVHLYPGWRQTTPLQQQQQHSTTTQNFFGSGHTTIFHGAPSVMLRKMLMSPNYYYSDSSGAIFVTKHNSQTRFLVNTVRKLFKRTLTRCIVLQCCDCSILCHKDN